MVMVGVGGFMGAAPLRWHPGTVGNTIPHHAVPLKDGSEWHLYVEWEERERCERKREKRRERGERVQRWWTHGLYGVERWVKDGIGFLTWRWKMVWCRTGIPHVLEFLLFLISIWKIIWTKIKNKNPFVLFDYLR